MFTDKDSLILSDIIDTKLLQKFQDFFANALNLASIIVDENGPITEPSNYNDFCNINIKNNILEDIDCDLHNPKWGKIAFDKGEPYIFKCRTGLTSFVVPISLDGKYLGAIIGGQVFTEPPNEDHFREIATQDNLNEDEYIEALRKIKIMSQEQINVALNQLSLFAGAISKAVHKNLELIENNKREELYKRLTEAIRSSLDIDETLEIIAHEIARMFGVERIAVAQFHGTDNFEDFYIRKEYKALENIISPQTITEYKKVGAFIAKKILETKKPFVVNETEKADVPDFVKEFYEKLGVKSFVWLPVMLNAELWGFITLSKTKGYKHWSEDDISLLESTASQLHMAIKHSELFEKEKKMVQREILLRDITSAISSTLDFNQIKKVIVNKLGSILGADLCGIYLQNPDNKKFQPIDEHSLYLSSNEIKSPLGENIVENYGWGDYFRSEKIVDVAYSDIEDFKKDYNLYGTEGEKFIDKYKIKSFLLVPIIYADSMLGILGINFIKNYSQITDEDINLVRTVATQAGIALHQAQLYEQEKETADREELLRRTIEIIRSTLEVEDIKKLFVEMVCNYFNADRCLFVDYDKENNKFLPFRIEKLADPEISSLVGIDLEQEFAEFCERLKRGKNVIIKDLEKTLLKKSLPQYKSLETLKQSGTKSDYGLYIKYSNQIMGILVMHFVKEKRVLTKEELEFLKVIRDQVGIALYQAEVYLQLKQQAQREYILRDITTKIRSSLNIEEIKNEIVNQVGNFFKADRVAVAYYDSKVQNYVITNGGEYRSSDDVKTFVGVDFINTPGFAEYIRNIHMKGKDIIFNDLEKYLDDNNLRNTDIENFYREFGFASSAAINMYYEDVFLGDLVISFERQRNLSNDEIDFLRVLADQIGVAFHQSELFNKEKQTAQKETLLRKTIEVIRSTLEPEKIKKYFVEITGNYFNADICMFDDYDPETGRFLPFEFERLKSPEIQSLIGVDPENEFPEFVAKIKRKRDVIVKDIDKIMARKDCSGNKALETMQKSGAKSGYGLVVAYKEQIVGILIMHFVGQKKLLTGDELDFLRTLRDQAGIGLHQAELFDKEKQTAQKENTLRQIMLSTARSFNFEEIINSIVTAAGKMLKADRCFYVEYDLENEAVFPIKDYAEYRSSENIRSHTTRIPDKASVSEIVKTAIKNQTVLVEDIDKIDLPEESRKMLVDDLGVKAYAIFSIYYGDIIYGSIVLHYVNNFMHLTEEEIDTAKSLTNQSAIIINQVKLYEKIQKTAEREKLLRKIIELSRSSLNLNEVKEKITEELCKAFKADRCYFRSYDRIQDKAFYAESEYITNNKLQSLTNVEPDHEAFRYFVKALDERKKAFYPLVVDEDFAKGTPVEDYMKNVDIKADYAIPIIDRHEELTWLLLHYSEIDPKLSEDDKKLLETIAYQLDIAFDQIKLYNTAKQRGEREVFLRNITETIRSSLDITETKQKIVEIIGKALNAGRCFIMEYDREQDKFLSSEYEYLASEEITSYANVDVNINAPNFLEALKADRSLIIKDKEIFVDGKLQDFVTEKQAIKDFDVNSAYGFPIFYNKDLLGVLGIHFISPEHDVSRDEFALIKVITEQVAVALHQSKLYNTIRQVTANQNAILTNIPFMAWLKDKESRLLAINMPYAKMAGTTIKKILGKTDYDFFPKELADLYVKEDKLVMEIKATVSSVDLIASTEDKSERWHETYKSPVLDTNGNAIGTVGLSRDVTEEKEAQLELILRQKEIMKANERESLLSKIIANAIKTFDMNGIKQIVHDVGIMTKADRCYFVEAYPDTMQGKPLDYEGEYLASPDIKSIVGYQFKTEDVKMFVESYTKEKDLIVFDYEKIREENNEQYQGVIRYSNLFDLKNSIGIPFFYNEKLTAVLVIEYVKEKVLPSEEELNFLRVLGNQVEVVYNQIQLYQNTKKTAERESLLRQIFEDIRSSLDINMIKKNLVNALGKALDANRCFIIMLNKETNTLTIDENSEYRTPDIEKSFVNYNTESSEVSWFAEAFKNKREFSYSNVEDFLSENNLSGSLEEQFIRENNIQSNYNVPISYGDNIFGFIVVEYMYRPVKLEEDNVNFLKIIAAQAGIAFNQAELFKKNKIQAEKESLLRQIYEDIRSSLDINSIKTNIAAGTGKALNADVCFIMDYEPAEHYFVIRKNAEYRSSDKEKSFADLNTRDAKVKRFVDTFKDRQEIIFGNVDEYIVQSKLQGTLEENFLRDYGIKSSYNIPIIYSNHLFGYLIIEYTNQYRDYDNDDLAFIRTIANQAGIALHQAELYEQTQIQAEREAFIRKIIEAVGESLDLETVLNTLCKEVFELFKPDRVAIENYPEIGDYTNWSVTAQYTSGDDILGVLDIDYPARTKEYIGTRLLEEGRDIIVYDLDKSDLPDYFIETHKKMGVKSLMAVPLKQDGNKWGILVLSQVHKYRKWSQNEIGLLHTVANQSAVAIRQAELYSQTKEQAEREKFGRNIIEILRSTIDKNMIKSLFVRYIGKFFDANRVFFCEYDPISKNYLPIDKNSEYLSSSQEISFAGFDWASESIREYTQPLLEKREFIISCWEEYINKNYHSSGFISRFEDYDIKSNYSFPVIYQEKMMGFFSISFTKDGCIKLPEEDINMIRNICMQAGIALFHADLYVHAKESSLSKESFIANMSKEIQISLQNIIENSAKLSRTELDKEHQAEYLQSLKENSKELIELKDNITSISEIESEHFKLNYEPIDAEKLIMNVFGPLKHYADERNVALDTEIVNAEINVDRKRLTKAIYNILVSTISLTPAGGHITIKTGLKDNKFYISIKDWGEGQSFYDMNIIFETLKQLDSEFTMRQKDVRLGLSVAKKLIELHNGCIHVDSMEDNGTNLWFIIHCK